MRLYDMIKREFSVLIRQPILIVVLFCGPIFLTLLFGGIYLRDYVEDIPAAVLDEDNSSMSRYIVSQFEESDRFNVKYYPASREELKCLIDSGKAQIGIYIPPDFHKDVISLKSSQVMILVDGSNLVVGNNAYAAAAAIVQTVAAGTQIKLLQAKGIAPGQAEKMAMVFNFNDRMLYDPRLTYMNYLMLGFVAVFLQQVMASSAGVSVVSDGAYLAEGNTFLKLASKILACSVVAISSTFISLLVVNRYFKVPVRGNLLTVLLMCTVFVFAVSCTMVVLASLLKDRLKVYQMSFMLSLPTFVSSGYVWPLDQMPVALQVIIKALWPLVNFQRPFADVIFKGVPFYAVSGSILQTALYTVLWMPAAVWILKKNYMVRAKKC